ncbi:hypothetical protein HID58_005742 [Brassica napus]|uniref:Legume lectin domain-containing protein n=1 Tax=Brassica napus TaxID=3708 RepID=A0ABQ8E9E6_BRANA|nr:hypothetical protein HID58_005742 [Brassica napus]
MQLWVEYDSKQKLLNVTLHPVRVPKPKLPLLSLQKDLCPYLLESMYVGFTSSTGMLTASHYILALNFKMNGTAQDIDLSRLPEASPYSSWLFLKRKKLLEVLEDWEVQFGPHRFAYKDINTATKGFKDTELLGRGGFGKVYKGALPVSNIEIAVKRGYCRRKGELYLVYDCMPKGSVDNFLYHQQKQSLNCQHLDQKIVGQDYSEEQVELVLKRGLLCSHPLSAIRPNMSSVIQYLDSVAELPHNLLDIAKARQVHGGDLQASLFYKNITIAISSRHRYENLKLNSPQQLRVSASIYEEDIGGLIGKNIIKDIKEKKEVKFGSQLFLTDCREKSTGVMRYACGETTLRFEPGS